MIFVDWYRNTQLAWLPSIKDGLLHNIKSKSTFLLICATRSHTFRTSSIETRWQSDLVTWTPVGSDHMPITWPSGKPKSTTFFKNSLSKAQTSAFERCDFDQISAVMEQTCYILIIG